MNTRTVGGEYEQMAADYLKKQGFTILERNYRCRSGEIDIVAEEPPYLVFVEVKYRVDGLRGDPMEAVTLHKQRQISRTAMYYMMRHGLPETTECRFDVVGICGEEIRHVRNAFDAVL